MFKEFFKLTLKGMSYRPLRSWLTVLGIVIGIMLVVVILALGGSIQNTVSKTLQMFGSDLIYILPGKETNPLLGFLGGQKFKEKDLMALEEVVGVEYVTPMEVATFNVEYQGEKKAVMIHAAPWLGIKDVYERSQGLKLEQGRWPPNDYVPEVVLGYRTARRLFKNPISVGDELIVKSKRMRVVGVVSEIGAQLEDNIVYISMNIYRQLTGTGLVAGSAFVKVSPNANIDLIAAQIRSRLAKQDVVREFSVLTPKKSERLVNQVLSVVELFLISIALISLVVGAVGIMNTMYTSVLERTKQIGIMKAIGASNNDILTLFLIESGMIGLVGGLIGIVFGILAAYGVSAVAAKFGLHGLFSFMGLDFLGLLAVLALTFVVGVVSGVLPARQAARLDPAEALRYE